AGPRTVVLAHGWNGRASQFAPLVRELVADGYRVISFDAPAHGESGGRGSYLIDWIDVLTTLQDQRGRFDAIVGHSFGGLATVVAVASGIEADRVVTVASLAEADSLLTQFQGMLGYSDAVAAALHDRFARRFFPGHADPFAWLSAVRTPLADDIPLLVVHDDGDRMVPATESARILAAHPWARSLTTSGLGHARILASNSFLDAVVAFVDEPLPGSRKKIATVTLHALDEASEKHAGGVLLGADARAR
ncbi:alpha/beta hydrolase, partial [Microbacterium yannicii]|uniref:alpha/beta hydrolase n=1 Tax=Microbacterium yannicii TaxID=671622 RepID=UPI00036BC8D5